MHWFEIITLTVVILVILVPDLIIIPVQLTIMRYTVNRKIRRWLADKGYQLEHLSRRVSTPQQRSALYAHRESYRQQYAFVTISQVKNEDKTALVLYNPGMLPFMPSTISMRWICSET